MPEDVTTKATTAIKALNETGRVGGYLVVWGDKATKDLQGEYFTPDTDLKLDWFDKRPMLYHHAQDVTIKSETVGVIDTLTQDEVGVWAEAQMNLREKYVQAVHELIKRGVLGWSSGSVPHLVEKAADGFIKRWPIVEGSATPTPAEPRQTDISTIKAAYKELGLDAAILEPEAPTQETPTPEDTGSETPVIDAVEVPDTTAIEPPAKEPESPEPDHSDSHEDLPSQEDEDMDTQQVVMAVIDQVLNALNASLDENQRMQVAQSVMAAMQQPEQNMDAARATEVAQEVAPAVTKAVSEAIAARDAAQQQVNGAAQAAVKNLFANMQPQPRIQGAAQPQPNPPTGARIQITRANKYSHLDVEDLGYLYDFMKRGSRRGPNGSLWEPSEDLLRTMADKTIKAVNNGQFTIGEDAIKAVHFLADQSVAIKADELDYSTQTGYGDEWVPDLWASNIWDKVRLDNVVASEVNMIDMPSNPFELPAESSDPTVYAVEETQDESQLLLSGSGAVIPDSKIGTAKVQLSATKLGLRVGFANELVEDAIVPVVGQFRRQAQRAIADSIDNVLINGDTDKTASTNINLIDGTPTNQKYTAQSGMLYQALVTTTANTVAGGGDAITLAEMRAARATLADQYKTPASMLRWFVDPSTYITILNISEILTAAEYGLDASVIKGDVRVIDGIPIYPTAEMALANTAGKIPAAGGTLGRAMLVRPSQWYLGYRRRPTVAVEYLSYYDAYVMTATVRIAIKAFDNDNVSVIVNLLV